MDYHDSSAGNARIAVIKLAATTNKLGTIFFNPGNPPIHHPRSSTNTNFLQVGREAQESRPSLNMSNCLLNTSGVILT